MLLDSKPCYPAKFSHTNPLAISDIKANWQFRRYSQIHLCQWAQDYKNNTRPTESVEPLYVKQLPEILVQISRCLTWWEWLLEFISFLFVWYHKGVQVTTTSHLELHLILGLLDFHSWEQRISQSTINRILHTSVGHSLDNNDYFWMKTLLKKICRLLLV